tara:strand:- start:12774 stop:13526 length:753 start_codon:yes stop_codon:yes gene_type:complete
MINKKDNNFIFGIRPIIEAIKSGKTIDKLLIQKGLHNELFSELWKLVRFERINYRHVPVEKINSITRKNHQGVLAFISPIEFYNIEHIIPNIYEKGKDPFILILDRVTDVRNFGSICRTAECLGLDAILIPEKNSAAINNEAVKTSSGSIHHIPICRTWNLKMSLEYIKNSGLQLIGCTEKSSESIYSGNFKNPTAILIGSEKDGISPEYIKMCDYKFNIPMIGKTSSLNVSVASGIIISEILRQRNSLN